MEEIKNIALSLVSCAIWSYICSLIQGTQRAHIPNNKEYIKLIRKQFYVCIVVASLIFLLTPIKDSGLWRTFVGILFFFCVVFATFAFMCLDEIVSNMPENSSDKDSD